MYNFLIAQGIAVVAFLLGLWAGGWVAGLVPALFAFTLAFFLLMRRSGRQLQPLLMQAQAEAQNQQFDAARATLRTALPLGKWQFLVEEQVHMQLGALDYLQAVMLTMQRQQGAAAAPLQSAREHLEKASPSGWRSWLLGWQPRAMLACVRWRQGDQDGAVKLLADTAGAPRTEPVFWALYAWMLNELKRREEALGVLATGLKNHANNGPLTEMRDALANKKRPKMIAFGEGWYQFFPEAMADDPKVIELARAQQERQLQQQRRPANNYSWPQPRR